MRAAASATRWGSAGSTGPGRRVSTRQNPQARVQRSPRIMKVAVPSFQHSEMLGQPASSHTVTSSRSRSVDRISRNVGPVLSGTRIHSGLRDRYGTESVSSPPCSRACAIRPSRRGAVPSPSLTGAPAPFEPLGAAAPSTGTAAAWAWRVNWAMSPGAVRKATSARSTRPWGAHTSEPRLAHEVHDLPHRDVDPLGRERRDPQAGDPAGHDPTEPAEVGIHVEREAVHGPGPRQPHPDGRDLAGPHPFGLDPHAGVAVEAPGREAQIGQHVDQQLLHAAHVGRRVRHPAPAPARHGENRIAHQLSRPVVGHLAAPVGLHDRAAQRLDIDQQVLPPPAPAQRHHMGVLQQQQVIVGGVGVEAALERQGVLVGNPAEPADPKRRAGGGLRCRAQRISASQSRVSMISLTRCRNAAA